MDASVSRALAERVTALPPMDARFDPRYRAGYEQARGTVLGLLADSAAPDEYLGHGEPVPEEPDLPSGDARIALRAQVRELVIEYGVGPENDAEGLVNAILALVESR